MSSYQFVNTLAQCYAAEQSAQQNPNAQDYYNMSYANCYSPSVSGHSAYSASYNLLQNSANSTGSSANNESNSDYSSLSGQRNNSNGSPTLNHGTTCKFSGDSSDSKRVTHSTQDYTRSSEENRPCSTSSQLIANSTIETHAPDTKCETEGSSESSNPNRSKSEKSQEILDKCSSAQIESGAMKTKNSDNTNKKDASSESGDSNSTNPPQIYPWMKRVHIGQSK